MNARIHFSLALFLLIGAAMPRVGWGARFYVGLEETLHPIAPVVLKDGNGDSLTLAFKTSAAFLGLGIFCKDDGYVLTRTGDTHRYYRLPARSVVKSWQDAGLLPRQMPEYKVPMGEYVLGYSLWWLFVLPATAVILAEKRNRRRRQQWLARTAGKWAVERVAGIDTGGDKP